VGFDSLLADTLPEIVSGVTVVVPSSDTLGVLEGFARLEKLGVSEG
jgi:hypothetical protein